jgi:hypothetical protein
VSVAFVKPVTDLSFVTGSPVDEAVQPATLSGKTLVEGSQALSPLVKLTVGLRQNREDEVRDILSRLVSLLKSSSGTIPTGPMYISPLNAEYYYTQGRN